MIQSVNQLVNDPSTIIKEFLASVVASSQVLYNIPGTQTLTLMNIPKEIGILCGGGSGHQPAHSGFVDSKILQAAVCGNIFTSPTYLDIHEGIKYINSNNGGKGVIVLITNQQGNLMNFGLAVQQALAENIRVKSIIVQDDAVFIHDQDQLNELHEQRRGLAGTVLLYKILGTAKRDIDDLNALYELGQKVNENLYTIGVGINEKSDNEASFIEIGLGIHGERAYQTIPFLRSNQLVHRILDMFQRFIQEGDEVVVLLNNLGSLTDLEIFELQYDLLHIAKSQLHWRIKLLITGKAMTSLNMKGFSITVLKLTNLHEKDRIVQYLCEQADCPAWKGLIICEEPHQPYQKKIMKYQTNLQSYKLSDTQKQDLEYLCTQLEKLQDYFNHLDTEVGDGDLGNTVKNGCKTILDVLKCHQDVRIFDIANKLASSMGGSFGPLFSTFIFGYDQGGLKEGLRRLKELGQTNLGDRTIVDVLEPLIDIYEQSPDMPWRELTVRAEQFALQVRNLKAKKGRSRYLAGKEIGQPDPGCELIVAILRIFSEKP